MDPSLVMEREAVVRRALGRADLRFRLLAPPYPAVGLGALRVLRLRERGPHLEIVAGYERYERRPGAQ